MNKCFALRRPLIEFNAEQMMQRTNNVFVFKALMPRSKIHRSRMVRLKQTDEVHHCVLPNLCVYSTLFSFAL